MKATQTYRSPATRLLARLLLAAYLLLLLKPVLPALQDRMAHRYWTEFHMAVVHKGKGAQHMHQETSRATDDAVKDKSGKQKAGAEFSVHLAVLEEKNSVSIAYSGELPAYSQFAGVLIAAVQANDDPPPERA